MAFGVSRILGGAAIVVGATLTLVACEEDPFSKSMTLGGKRISADTLNAGKESYTHYCRACHGDKGDGHGPSALGLRPPPRDFTQGKFKFAAVESGSLPNDADFRRIVTRGLHGTAMLPWEVPAEELSNIIQFIKTFSPKWQKEKPGKPLESAPDPWVGQEAAGIQRGKELYHVTTQCAGCHPNYATRDDIAAMTMKLKKFQVASFREDMYGAVLKESEYRTTLNVEDDPVATKHGEGKEQHAKEGLETKEHAKKEAATKAAKYFVVSILPPDFTQTPLRSGDELADLYRTIAAGVGGTAMPSWKATAPYTDPNTGEHWDGDNDIWALAHYVKSLVKLRGTKDADAMRERFAHQPPYTPPPPAPEPAATPAPVSSATPPAAKPPKAPKQRPRPEPE